MTKENEIRGKYFTESGCLNLEALKKYRSSGLSEQEKEIIKVHLEKCELCTDALEGLSLISDQDKLADIVNEINENLRDNLLIGKKRVAQKSKTIKIHNRVLYFSIAASVLILIGIFSYFKFYWQKPYSEITALTEKAIEESIPPVPQPKEKKESETAQVKKPEPIEEKTTSEDIKAQKPKKSAERKKETLQHKKIKYEDYEHEILLADENVEEENITEIEETPDTFADLASVDHLVEYSIGGIVVSGGSTADNGPSLTSTQQRAGIKRAQSYQKDKSKKFESYGEEQLGEPEAKVANAIPEHQKATSQITESDDEEMEQETVFAIVEQMPQFIGGNKELHKYLQKNLKYPQTAKEAGIQGTIHISFIVEETGEVSNAKVVRGIGGGCDEEALRVIESMPVWSPGLQRGKPIRVQFNMPIVFTLN